MKTIILILLTALAINTSGDTVARPSFSAGALEWLLSRKEYDRFDWYVERYLGHHPDTAILYLLKATRYYEEAIASPQNRMLRLDDPGRALPRKYPQYIAPFSSRELMYNAVVYDERLVDKAYAAMRKARQLQPHRQDIAQNLCRMAAAINDADVFAYETATYINSFGCDSDVVRIVFEYVSGREWKSDNRSMLRLLQSMQEWCPEQRCLQAMLNSELGKHFYRRGNLDSAYAYTIDGIASDTCNVELIGNAVIIASIRGDFMAAEQWAMKRYRCTADIFDLEQAVICAFVVDTVRAYNLLRMARAIPGYRDSASIVRWFFDEKENPGSNLSTRYFAGDLFYLNFPLIEYYFRKNRDWNDYCFHKAGAFYCAVIYDSAAYYNLNLLRNSRHNEPRGINTLYNLAAEYYASGEYLLSYLRFLDLFHIYDGRTDAGVRLGLGLNYEKFGDFSRARAHYSYAARHRDRRYPEEYNLRRYASFRLEQLNKK